MKVEKKKKKKKNRESSYFPHFFSRVFIFAVGIIPNFLRVLIFDEGGKICKNRED